MFKIELSSSHTKMCFYDVDVRIGNLKNVWRAWLVLGKCTKWILILLKLHTCTPMSLDCRTSKYILFEIETLIWHGSSYWTPGKNEGKLKTTHLLIFTYILFKFSYLLKYKALQVFSITAWHLPKVIILIIESANFSSYVWMQIFEPVPI